MGGYDMVLAAGSQAETTRLGEALGGVLSAGDTVLITGDLGAGKSVLSRGIARGLGVDGPMPSPTFTLMQPYRDGRVPVYHYDLYRLSDADEFYAAGLDEYIGADGVALVEWPMADVDIPDPVIRVEITRGAGESDRVLHLQYTGAAEQRIAAALKEWEARA